MRESPERKSERKHWNVFWEQSDDVADFYSNEGRVSSRLAVVADPAGTRVLEVGAGTGRDGILLAGMGASVVSLDYSLPSLTMIGSQLDSGGRVDLCCGDAFALPFADGTFDIVFHQGLLEHFRNPGDLIAENARVLKPGGLILVDVPQRYHYYTVVKHLLITIGRWFAGWETEYSAGQLERLLRDHGFRIVTSYGEWFNPPIWYRMMRRALSGARIRLPMYPWIFTAFGKLFAPVRRRLLSMRWTLYTTVIVGTIGKKRGDG